MCITFAYCQLSPLNSQNNQSKRLNFDEIQRENYLLYMTQKTVKKSWCFLHKVYTLGPLHNSSSFRDYREFNSCWESARQGTSRLRRLSAWSSTLCCLCSWVRAGYLLVWAQAIKRARSSSHARLELCGEALKSTKLNIAQVFLFGYTSTRLTTTFIWGQKPDYGLQKCRQNFTKLCNLTDIQVEASR